MADIAQAPAAPSVLRRWIGETKSLGTAGMIGLVLVALVLAGVLIGPLIWRLDPTQQQLSQAMRGISAAHPLGTDHLGRDLLARVMYGGRLSLVMGFGSVLAAMAAGVAIGATAAMRGGWVEAVLMRLIDSLLSIPGMVQAVILVAIIGRGIVPLIVALAIYSLPIFARVAHQTAKQLLNSEYVLAAVAMGSGQLRLAFVHIVPNFAAPIVTIASFRVGANLLTGAALNFFGLGAQAPSVEWGLMIAEGQRYSWQAPMLTLVPGLALMVTTLGLNLLGDGVRHRLDPKTRNSL